MSIDWYTRYTRGNGLHRTKRNAEPIDVIDIRINEASQACCGSYSSLHGCCTTTSPTVRLAVLRCPESREPITVGRPTVTCASLLVTGSMWVSTGVRTGGTRPG